MSEGAVLAAETTFFDALLAGDQLALERILSDDFMLIDVMTGSEIQKPILVDVVSSRVLEFLKIDRLESTVRFFGSTAVVTGRTHMEGRYHKTPFESSSRYTHLFFLEPDGWKMVSAQGTPISDPVL